VAKVDALFEQTRALRARMESAGTVRDRLQRAAVGRLVALAPEPSPDPQWEGSAAPPPVGVAGWGLLSAHFDALHTTPAHIDLLKQAILQLAVMGRLVPQDPNDEPASVLLERIAAEKAKLVKSRTIAKDKKLSILSKDNPPNEIPENWAWTRLQDVFEISRGGSPRPAGDPRFFGGDVPWITVREITKDNEKYLTNTSDGLTAEGRTRSRDIFRDDLLLTNSGATLGVPKVCKIYGCANDGVAILRQHHSYDLNDFTYLFLSSQTLAFRNVNQGMGQPNLNTSIIAGWYIPIPPISEQKRIVAKVDELLALCERLAVGLDSAETTRTRLLDAILAKA
jgi:type I restriction enzyme S subunit